MISAGMYVRAILKKRNMSQMDLLRKMYSLGLGNGTNLHREHLNKALNSNMTYLWARRIEIALELPDYALIKMVGNPTPVQWEKIKEVKPNV